MSSGRLFLHHYSTTGLPPAQRHEAFVNRDWPSLGPVFRSFPIEPFDMRSDTLALGDVTLQYGHVTRSRWIRDEAVMRSYDPDAMSAAITLAGGARGEMGERAFRTRPGSLHLVDLSAVAAYEAQASQVMLIGVARGVAEQAGLNVRDLHGVVIETRIAAMLRSHLMGIAQALPELTTADVPRLARTTLDLLALAVAGSGRKAGMDGPTRRRTALMLARREIEEGLGSPSLTIANLCRRLLVSRTTLHRLFEAEGGVQAYIRERRLVAASRVLDDPASQEPLYAIAERLGFSDAAHLSRLFRERFGLSPSDYRVRSREAARG